MVYIKWNGIHKMQPIKIFHDIGKYSLLSENKDYLSEVMSPNEDVQ